MIDPMSTIMKLFLVLTDDSKTTEEVLPLADQLFHAECRMNMDGQMLNKPRIMADMEAIVKNKVTMNLSKIEQDQMGGIHYEYNVRQPREKAVKMVANAKIRDGKIYNVAISRALVVPPENPHIRRATAPVIHGF